MYVERHALIVGIDTYAHASKLSSCVADAEAVGKLLEKNGDKDKTPNYVCRVLLDKMEDGQPITRAALREACEALFKFTGDVLFYFSGHGVLTPYGGLLCANDSKRGDWGVAMQDIVQLAFNSVARDITLILDCCHGGDIANPGILNSDGGNPLAVLRENMTVIAASLPAQSAVEAGGHGLFTAALLDALVGGAADHMGWVTAPSIYAYVERRFGSWEARQRPVYKSHATSVRVVRECAPLIDRAKLHRLIELFPTQDHKYRLTPAHEPHDEHGKVHKPVDREKVEIAALFKDYRDAGLLKPSKPNEQLFWTARRRHTVELTLRGQEYWWLVMNKKI